MTAPALAMSSPTVSFTTATVYPPYNCGDYVQWFSLSYLPNVDDGGGFDYGMVVIVDGLGTVYYYHWLNPAVGSTYTANWYVDFRFNGPIHQRPLTIALVDLPDNAGYTGAQALVAGVVRAEDTIDPALVNPACSTLPLGAAYTFMAYPMIPDGRLNAADLAAPVAIYADKTGIEIWSADGEKLIDVDAEALAALPEHPDENLLIGQNGDSALYKLTTGEYQVNVGPDDGGLVYVVIWSGLPPEHIYNASFSLAP